MDVLMALSHLTQSPAPVEVLSSFVSAYDFVRSEKPAYVAFKIKAPCKDGINYCRLELSGDNYTLEFGEIANLDYKVKGRYEALPIESLKRVFEEKTGNYLSFD